MMKRILTVILATLFIGFVGLGINDLRNAKELNSVQQIQLEDKNLQLNELLLQKQRLNEQFEEAVNEKDINEEKVQQLEREKLELEERYRQLEVSKANEKARIAEASRLQNTNSQVAGASTGNNITGNKESWLRASGIPESEWWAVDSIVSRESSWNPNAVNPTSGACGLGQQLPCGKWAGAWNDPVAALKAQYQYVVARYGGYPQAVAFWNANHWY